LATVNVGGSKTVNNLPSISVVILNFNGLRYLDRCLRSALALDYPADRLEIVLCDNGSQDGSSEYVRTQYPAVRILALARNHGFAEGNNLAAKACRNEWVAFLNNDMWFEPSWLRDLVSPLEEQPGLACLTSRILNWDGTAIDFIGGGVNFEGHGFQVDHGLKASTQDRARRVIAPCGGAMVIRRELFLELGGFDPDYFSFFEDTDLGWRLNLLGHDVWYTPGSTVYHAGHGSFRRLPAYQLRVLYERNALFTIYKCLDDANLAAALPMALLLMNERALRIAQVSLGRFTVGSDPVTPSMQPATVPGALPADETLEPEGRRLQAARRVLRSEGWAGLALKGARFLRQEGGAILRRPLMHDGYFLHNLAVSHYVAMHQFASSLGVLVEKRRWVQSRRLRSDEDLIPLLAEPLRPTWDDPAYRRFYDWLTGVAGLSERFRAPIRPTASRSA
jgi:GT2 family glycosyltransferase